jgi:thiamine-monophosphate kinase
MRGASVTTSNSAKRAMNTLENDLVRRIRLAAATPPRKGSAIRLGIGDDAALFASRRGYETILTCDWFLEGTHFRREKHSADSVGWKCLARAISDIAAMGGEPRGFLLSLALPDPLTGRWLTGFLGGLRRAARKFKCPLAGGDTTRQSKVLIHITVVGEVRAGRAVPRAGARRGDLIFVSGRLGEAELGLQLLWSKAQIRKDDPALQKHLYPQPRIALGRWLADRRLATTMMDLSDGLSTDLPRLCAASEVGACLETSLIPAVRISSVASPKKNNPLELALNGGDDYELLFTVRPSNVGRLPQTFQGIQLTAIGEITRERRLTLLRHDGTVTRLKTGGWDPFGSSRRALRSK